MKTSKDSKYLHGFTKQEQDRLYNQARVFEKDLFVDLVDFKAQSHLIEIGSGVGAQTEILLEKFPHLKIQCVDASATQVARAKHHLKTYAKKGRVRFHVGDASEMPFESEQFDGGFICWLLEHVPDPLAILKETHRVLRPGGRLVCNEVFNTTFYVHPYSPATLQYWFEFNDFQWSIRGDPFVGTKLGNYLTKSGFRDVETSIRYHHLDNRQPKKRAQLIQYWSDLLLSAAPGLIEARRVTPAMVKAMRKELTSLKRDPDAVFFYGWVQAVGFADHEARFE
jgi:ubiquinone/menaquinone biosynthesis C-methylase UbiE